MISSNPAGINCGQACSANFIEGTQVTLTAAPMANSFFAGWSGACSGIGVCEVTLTKNASVTAAFNASQSTPVLTVSLAGNGMVSSNPSGINCGPKCSASFNVGTQVTLTATAVTNSYFVGWSGACSGIGVCNVTLTKNTSVVATFSASPMLTVTLGGTGKGSVASNPLGINCGPTCSASFNAGTQVTLTATTATNSYFAGWAGGGCSGNSPTCTLTLKASQQVTATFNTLPVLTVSLAGTGTGTVSSNPSGINCKPTCSASFNAGTQVTLTETPGTNSSFVGWDGACKGDNSICTLTLSASQQVTATFNPQNITALNHIIFLAQENRSFDHYFGALRGYWAQNGYPDQSFDGLPQFNPTSGIAPLWGPPPVNPGCDPAFPPPSACQVDSNSPQIQSYQLITQCLENPGDGWGESHVDWNVSNPVSPTPTLDGFVFSAANNARGLHPPLYDTSGIRAMGYNDATDLNYYYFMATNFATSDRWFSPVMTRTPPNRQYLVASTSQGHVHRLTTKNPPLTATTIFQELQQAGITWKIYVNPLGSTCTGPPYDPKCLLGLSVIQDFAWGQTIPKDYPQNIAPMSEYFSDLTNSTLPQVALIEPASDAGLDEHPTNYDRAPSNIQLGANYVSSLINGLMGSSSWKDSVFILTYDEFGGLYDHVPPQPTVSPDGIKPVDLQPYDICYPPQTGPTCDFVYTGYRMPLIAVSPYTKQNYVSHTVADITAILKLIETRFNLSALTQRDGAQMDMTEFFDFNNPVWITPPTPPAQNTNGACYVNKLP
ncbi:MAG TPA: alkaline phosphatase family protein [Terriglobales bacterium]|nr:alkaline phosphatase family protein [Terriglobales bacterium]